MRPLAARRGSAAVPRAALPPSGRRRLHVEQVLPPSPAGPGRRSGCGAGTQAPVRAEPGEPRTPALSPRTVRGWEPWVPDLAVLHPYPSAGGRGPQSPWLESVVPSRPAPGDPAARAGGRAGRLFQGLWTWESNP